MRLSEIAHKIGGELQGEDVDIIGVSNLDVQEKDTIAYAEKKKNLNSLKDTEIAALILPPTLEYNDKPVIRVDNPKLAFSTVLKIFSQVKEYPRKIYPNTYIEDDVKLGDNVGVLPFSTIMNETDIGDNTLIYSHVFIGQNVSIGKNCVIKSGVRIDDRTVIGDNVIIHHNSVIGGEGFGYVQDEGLNKKVPQIGRIVIGNDCEIGACVTIDRATIGDTVIGEDVKVDNLVQIAHNTRIGDHSILVSQVGIAGSSTLGKRCILAGQVGVADHIEIGDNVVILSKTGVDKKKIESNSVLFGIPARDVIKQRRIVSSMDRLPDLIKQVREIAKKLDNEEQSK